MPYLWGTTGIGYNEDKIKKILGDARPDSWNYIYDPKLAAKFKDCGISLLDAPDEIAQDGARVDGPRSEQPEGRGPEGGGSEADADPPVRPQDPLLAVHRRPRERRHLCIAVGWSGDILQARDRADEAGQGVKIKYAIPKEGTIVWFDMLAIPADAKHPKNAHAFINYLMESAGARPTTRTS